MVYNAMKLFMEVQPQLFDECSNNYAEKQTNAPSEVEQRQIKWERIAQVASNRKSGGNVSGGPNGSLERLLPLTAGHGQKIVQLAANSNSNMHMDGAGGDAFGHDRLGRLKDLTIQEESVPGRLGGGVR